MAICKGRLGANKFDLVQSEISQNPPPLHVHYFALVVHEVVHGEIFFQRIINAVEPALLQAGKIKRRFTQSFAGNRARVDAASTHVLRSLDNRDALAKISSLRSGLLARRAAANHNQIKIFGRTHLASPTQAETEFRSYAMQWDLRGF